MTEKTAKTEKKKVNYLPENSRNISPYFTVSNAKKAIEFYEKVFDGKCGEILDMNGKVGHAEIMIGDSSLMISDEFPGMGGNQAPREGVNSRSSSMTHLYVKNVDETVKLAEDNGAKVIRQPKDQFYGNRSAYIVDPFGYQWYIATHIEDVSMDEMKERLKNMPDMCEDDKNEGGKNENSKLNRKAG